MTSPGVWDPQSGAWGDVGPAAQVRSGCRQPRTETRIRPTQQVILQKLSKTKHQETREKHQKANNTHSKRNTSNQTPQIQNTHMTHSLRRHPTPPRSCHPPSDAHRSLFPTLFISPWPTRSSKRWLLTMALVCARLDLPGTTLRGASFRRLWVDQRRSLR